MAGVTQVLFSGQVWQLGIGAGGCYRWFRPAKWNERGRFFGIGSFGPSLCEKQHPHRRADVGQTSRFESAVRTRQAGAVAP
jgi:hypothetical protein